MPSNASAPHTALARPVLPELGAAGHLDIPAAPVRPDDERGWLAVLLPGLSALGMLGFAVLSPNVLVIALSGGFALLSVVGAVVAGRQRRRRSERTWAARCEHYRAELVAAAKSLAEAAGRQQAHALAAHPTPRSAAAAVSAGAVWERRPSDEEHLRVRLGTGHARARLSPRRTGGEEAGADATLAALARDVRRRYGAVAGLPLGIDLPNTPAAVALGDALPLVRALIISLTRAHGPHSVRIHALAAPAELAWIRLLPHAGFTAGEPAAFAAGVRAQVRATAGDPGAPLHAIVLAGTEDSSQLAWRALASVLEGPQRPRISLIGLLPEGSPVPQEARAVVTADGEGGLLVRRTDQVPSYTAIVRPDAISHAEACRYAEAMRRSVATQAHTDPGGSPLLLESLPPGATTLQIPIGRDDEGGVVLVDPREAARHGDGPHGLIVGATGSGKSELLRTLLTAAAQQNRPDELTFLLVDFKGGAALSELAALPHNVGLLTNLSADVHGIARLCAALRAELRRRQVILRGAGVDDIDSYDPAAGEPLPRLLVVVDEYAELIEQSPDMLDVLTSLARLGRSLGIHLLLCSQRLDDGRLRGLEAHLRYRICLRTFTAAESVAAVGSSVAASLPAAPGWAYLSRDGELTRFRVALVANPAAAAAAVARDWHATPPQPVCLPPLPETLTLDGLPPTPHTKDGAAVSIGLRDLPGLGGHPPLRYDLASDGHLAVVGAPRSGRSTLLTTLVGALAAAVPARELAVHIVAPSDGPLSWVAGLPHVGTVATSPELAACVIRAVADAVRERRSPKGAAAARLLLVIDDLGALLAADDSLAPAISAIAGTGQSVGVTLAVSCGRWAELRGGLREAIATRFELACPDPSDSMLPQLARTFVQRPAGRVLTGDGTWAQIALPRVDGRAEAAGLNGALSELVTSAARRGGPATQPIQLLPALVPALSLPRPGRPGAVVLGVCGPYARPVEVGLTPGEHLLVLGNAGSGRSGLLRALALSLHDSGARTWLVAPRRSLGGVPGATFRRAISTEESVHLVEELLATRRRGADPAGHDVLIVDDQELVGGRGGAAGVLVPLLDVLPYAADVGLSLVIARRLSGYARAAYEPFFSGLLELCDTAVVLSGDPSEGPVIGGVRPRRQPPGRGQLVVRGEPSGELQTAWYPGDPSHLVAPEASRRFAEPGSEAHRRM